jgi:hypothetical protein
VIAAVPYETPITIPVEVPIVATPVALLLHVPPDEVLESVTEEPIQTGIIPVIAAGNGFTVTVVVV